MLGWALAEHADFATSFEADFITELYQGDCLSRSWRRASRRSDGWLAKHQVSLQEFCAHLGGGLDQMYRSRLDAARWIDATPRHVLMGPQLALLFPQGRFLHIIREGREAVDSMIHSGFSAWSARSFTLACLTWVRYVRAGRKLAGLIPDRVHTVRYEQLTNDDERWQAVFDFLGVEAHVGSAEFVSSTTINSSFGCTHDANGARPRRPSRGKPWSKLQQVIFNRIAGPLMTELGYPMTSENSSVPVRL
jgi:hypothetical protein